MKKTCIQLHVHIAMYHTIHGLPTEKRQSKLTLET